MAVLTPHSQPLYEHSGSLLRPSPSPQAVSLARAFSLQLGKATTVLVAANSVTSLYFLYQRLVFVVNNSVVCLPATCKVAGRQTTLFYSLYVVLVAQPNDAIARKILVEG